MTTVMDYEDSDDGVLIVTVCETDVSDFTSNGCVYGNEGSTSIELELMPNAYPEIVYCDPMMVVNFPIDWLGQGQIQIFGRLVSRMRNKIINMT